MTKDYANFSAADFLTDDAFVNHQLSPTPESKKFWTQWRSAYDTKQYDEAVEVFKAIRTGLHPYENTVVSAEVKQFIFSRIQESNQKATFFRHNPRTFLWLAAASVVMMLGFGYYFLFQASSYTKNVAALASNEIQERISLNKPLLIHLPDGSAIKLAPRSKISYPAQFDKTKRVVILSGEATFDIAKDPTRPFLVMANEVTTKVLGTRFHVNAYENRKDIVVTVEEGKVSVFKNVQTTTNHNALTGVVLLPNQQVIFDRKTNQYDKKLIQAPTILNTSNPLTFVFEETPLKTVIKKIEMAYGVEIVYDETVLSDCQITGSFDTESLFQKLDIITKSIGGSYEVVEGKVVINSRGCQ